MNCHEIPVWAVVKLLRSLAFVVLEQNCFVIHVLGPLYSAFFGQFFRCESWHSWVLPQIGEVHVTLQFIMSPNETHYTPGRNVKANPFYLDPPIYRQVEMIAVKPVLTQTYLSSHQEQI